MIIKVIIDQIINIKLFRIMYIMLNKISKKVKVPNLRLESIIR